MIKRLARYAETLLLAQCATGGALCHQVEEDESGWDALVELPAKKWAGPADTHPPAATAYVQVKSTSTGLLACRVKLSNALRAAQSPQPWFVVLVAARSERGPVRLYAVHVWDELMRRTLKAVRQAENEGRALHRATLSIRFSARDERKDDLVPWMQAEIDAMGTDYAHAKRTIFETAGYEEGYGEGVMTLEAGSADEIEKNFLGLGAGLRVTEFRFTPSRFGLPSSRPQIETSSAIIHITPIAAGDIEIRIRSPQGVEPILLPGKVYSAPLPGVPRDKTRVRFSASFVELLWGPDGFSDFSARLEPGELYDLATIADFITLNTWFAGGPFDIQVWSEGERVVAGTLRQSGSSIRWDLKRAAAAVGLLRSIAGRAPLKPPKVSLHDLSIASGLQTLGAVAGAPSVRVEFDPSPDDALHYDRMLYWFYIDVSVHSFYALVERTVREDVFVDGKRRVTAGPAAFVEAYVRDHPAGLDRTMMERDYERHLARLTEDGSVYALGDLREFILATRQPADPGD